MRRILILLAAGLFGLLLLIQLIPYGRQHNNPPVVKEPNWDSPQTREIAKRACFDCHSNETVWPWYSNVAPVSWLIQRQVDEGRHELNFSYWKQDRRFRGLPKILAEGSMPPASYLFLHPEAKLSPSDIETLVDGLQATANR